MKFLKTTLLSVFLLVSACSTIEPPDLISGKTPSKGGNLTAYDYFDAGTTAIAVAGGASEVNPFIGVAGDTASPLVALLVKLGLRNGLPIFGVPQEGADSLVDATSLLGGCANSALILGLAEFPATLVYGAGCYLLSLYFNPPT